MGLRDRIKGRVKKIIGGGGSEPAVDKGSPAGWMPSTAATPSFDAPTAPVEKAVPVKSAVAVEEAAPVEKAKAVEKAAPAKKRAVGGDVLGPDDGPGASKERMARLKAKKAVLQQLDKLGGEAGMKDLHDFSERRYFVAHKAFSDLMEEYTGQGLIDFDGSTYQCVLTDRGRAWVEAAGHIKTREK
ncbi:MAG: hypothetical protein H6742_12520 [Alphaproteobacteria bacterium]|nr:hypothetical protein [Alphaproteobacteria bacterium]